MDSLKVTILLSTYNRSHLISDTLDSLINQTFFNWECLIIDDNSEDNTSNVVENYTLKDSRFSYYLKPNSLGKGLSSSRNYGLTLARTRDTDFIQFFDDDDLMHPKKLEIQLKLLTENPQFQFCLCGTRNFITVDEIKWNEIQIRKPLGDYILGEAYLKGIWRFVAQVPLFRFKYASNFCFDEDLFYAEEWALFSMQFLLTPPQFAITNRVLFYRRKHENSQTERKDEDFSRRKTSAIVELKIFEFLTFHNIHTKVTLFYFTRKFLFYNHDSDILAKIKIQLLSHPSINRIDYLKFQLALFLYSGLKKIILKLFNY
jgi:glycosyltransferase involved in cell wall biosynthesis